MPNVSLDCFLLTASERNKQLVVEKQRRKVSLACFSRTCLLNEGKGKAIPDLKLDHHWLGISPLWIWGANGVPGGDQAVYCADGRRCEHFSLICFFSWWILRKLACLIDLPPCFVRCFVMQWTNNKRARSRFGICARSVHCFCLSCELCWLLFLSVWFCFLKVDTLIGIRLVLMLEILGFWLRTLAALADPLSWFVD